MSSTLPTTSSGIGSRHADTISSVVSPISVLSDSLCLYKGQVEEKTQALKHLDTLVEQEVKALKLLSGSLTTSSNSDDERDSRAPGDQNLLRTLYDKKKQHALDLSRSRVELVKEMQHIVSQMEYVSRLHSAAAIQ